MFALLVMLQAKQMYLAFLRMTAGLWMVECVMFQQEAAERQGRLEQEQKVLADALTAAEKKVAEEKGDHEIIVFIVPNY